jgi:hypothetical protein
MLRTGLSATDRPSRNSAQGAAAFDIQVTIWSIACGGSTRSQLVSRPAAVASMKGLSAIRDTTPNATASGRRCEAPTKAMSAGTSENSRIVSDTKISATGAVASAPRNDRTSGGPI